LQNINIEQQFKIIHGLLLWYLFPLLVPDYQNIQL